MKKNTSIWAVDSDGDFVDQSLEAFDRRQDCCCHVIEESGRQLDIPEDIVDLYIGHVEEDKFYDLPNAKYYLRTWWQELKDRCPMDTRALLLISEVEFGMADAGYHIPENTHYRIMTLDPGVMGNCTSGPITSPIIGITDEWGNCTDNILKQTLYHELLHAIYPKDGHGGRWLKAADRLSKFVNLPIRPTIKIYRLPDGRIGGEADI